MSRYTEDTYSSVWLIEDWQGQDYRVVKNLHDEYQVFCANDVEEASYTNIVVKKNFTRLNGKFSNGDHYFEVLNNFLHSSTNAAICCPCGLDIYVPNTDTTHHLLHGKLLSFNTWLEKIRNTDSWPEAMANVLGSRAKSAALNN